MKKTLPYLVVLVILGAVGFFLWKKMKEKKTGSVIAMGTPKALSAAAAATPKKRRGGWRSRIGGFAKKGISMGVKLGVPGAGQALSAAGALGIPTPV